MDNEKNSDIDMTNLCRLCAEINEEMIYIFSKAGEEKKLANKINSNLPITVSESDQLPLKVCLRCMLWLEMICTMHKTCIEANKFLHSLLGIYLKDNGVDVTAHQQLQISEELQAEASTSKIPHPTINTAGTRNEHKSSRHTPTHAPLTGTNITSEDRLREHKKYLHECLTITCSMCNIFFATLTQLQDHFTQIHPNEEPRRTPVEVIPEVIPEIIPEVTYTPPVRFVLAIKPDQHIEELIPSPEPILSPEPIPSPELFDDAASIETFHENASSKTVTKKRGRKKVGNKNRKIRKEIKKYRYCPTCKLRFNIEDRAPYKAHLKIHAEVLKKEKMKLKEEKLKNSSICCDYCDLHFLSEKSKLFHMRCRHKEYKTYICEICGVLFHTNSCLKNHKITKHTNEKKFLCDTCGKAFKLKSQLRNHVRVHVESLVECTVCHKYIQPYIIKRHIIQHTRGRRYQCSMCPKAFYRKPHLEQHVGVHLKHTYECDICGRIYSRKTNLYPHRKRHEDPLTGKFICLVYDCKKQFFSQSELVSHCNEHTREEILVKVHGRSKVYQSGGYLKVGPKKSPTSFQCCYCESNVSHLTIYLNHMKKHVKDDPSKEVKYICSICDGQFSKSSDFLEHLTVHPEAYTFACDFCRESFVSYKHKMIHVNKVHKNDFQCKICFDSFNSTKALRDHKLSVHIEERKYPCTYCDRRFTQKRYLVYHLTIHTGEKKFACGICSRTFRLKGDLNIHMKTHINDMPYKCSKCNFCSKVRRELVIHLSKVHSDASDSD